MSDSRLPAQISECGDDVLHTSKRLRGLLDELVTCGDVDKAQGAIAEIRAVLCGLSATGNRIKAYVAAGKMSGLVEAPGVQAEALELHPVNRPDRADKTHQLILERLHWVGDHTLDEEGDR